MTERTGIFSIIGRPNAGKSTLLNALCGEKISIVSDKPQTTRRAVRGVCEKDGAQLVFIDTPGLFKAKNSLGDYMTRVIETVGFDADAAVFLVEPVARIGVPEQMIIKKIKETRIPCVVVINKTDTVKEKDRLLAVMALYGEALPNAEIIPVSAKTGDGVRELEGALLNLCIESPALYPEGQKSDLSVPERCAETVREKLLLCLDKEVPHGTAVEIELFSDKETLCEISAVIYCEKAGHKGIIIGKKGETLKKIGSLSRRDIEEALGKKVFLQLWVKVKENWRDDPARVRAMGYREDD